MKKCVLGDYILDMASGPFGSNLKVECFVPSGFPIIDGANLYGVRVTDNVTKFVTEEKARSLSRSIAKRHDVIVTISGTLGQVAYIPSDSLYEEYLCSQRQFRVTFDESKIDVEYLVNLLHTDYGQKKILSFANYVGVPALSQPLPNFRRIELELPDIEKQHKVAKIISTIDRKIALNRKRIATLEAMAKEIYDYWFVQFDFPDAHGRPYKSSGGAMVYNPDLKREIPKGWEVGDFTDLIDFTMGQSPAGSTLNDAGDGVLFYQGATDFGLYFPSPRQFTNNPVRMARAGDVLLSVRAPVGTLNFASDDCCVGRGLGAFRGKETSNLFVWFYLRSLKPYFDSKNVAGTTFGSIGKDDFKMLKTIIPAKPTLCAYNEVSENIYKQMLLCNCEMSYDGKLRDFLLPLLMNGQVKVG